MMGGRPGRAIASPRLFHRPAPVPGGRALDRREGRASCGGVPWPWRGVAFTNWRRRPKPSSAVQPRFSIGFEIQYIMIRRAKGVP